MLSQRPNGDGASLDAIASGDHPTPPDGPSAPSPPPAPPLAPSVAPSLEQLRDALEPFVDRPLGSALRTVGQDLAAYAALVVAIAALGSPMAVMAAGVGVGIVVANLFMIGHDAAHGSFTRYRGLNAVVARIVFTLCLHPLGAWRHVHHDIHHRHPNDRSIDPVWRPLSPEEYRAANPLARLWHRLSRTTPGLGLSYAAAVWGRELMGLGPRRPQIPGLWRDRLATVGAFGAFGAFGWWIGGWPGALALSVIPFTVLCWEIGFVVFFNHTHPDVAWWSSAAGDDRDPAAAQLDCTVRLVFPRRIARYMGNIMDHTAHHVHPGVPLVNLGRAQAALDALVGERIVTVRWSPRVHRRLLATCRLYDEGERRWLGWDGRPVEPGV